jgi:hypothetical protein
MTAITQDKTLWVKSFKRLLTNLFKDLEQLKATLSKDTKCAALKLEPHRPYTEDLFMETRFEVFAKDTLPETAEKDAARIVCVFPKDYKPLLPNICEFLRGKLPADIRVNHNQTQRVYITKTNLPTLDQTVHVSQQVENIKKYGEACDHLQRLWKSMIAELDTYVKTAKP